eukprot:3326266-Amphidinium_carterae.1
MERQTDPLCQGLVTLADGFRQMCSYDLDPLPNTCGLDERSRAGTTGIVEPLLHRSPPAEVRMAIHCAMEVSAPDFRPCGLVLGYETYTLPTDFQRRVNANTWHRGHKPEGEQCVQTQKDNSHCVTQQGQSSIALARPASRAKRGHVLWS